MIRGSRGSCKNVMFEWTPPQLQNLSWKLVESASEACQVQGKL